MKDRNIEEYFSKEAIAKRQAERKAKKQEAAEAKAIRFAEQAAIEKSSKELKEWLHTRNQGDKFGQGEGRFGPEDMDDLDTHGSKLLGDSDHSDI